MADTNSTVETVPCEADGFEFEATVGSSLMLALKDTGFDIEASCEGSLACGTCHVRLRDDWVSRIPAPGEDERAMLASLPDATPASRLSCQIRVTPELAGLCLDIPR
jgi:2Fe-2S ferredoxin